MNNMKRPLMTDNGARSINSKKLLVIFQVHEIKHDFRAIFITMRRPN